MRIQFLIECCCCLSSNSFNPSSPFDISKTFPCRLFIIFPFAFLSASCWPKYLVINSTALFKSLSCNSTLICELRVFSYISNNLLIFFSVFHKQLNNTPRHSVESMLLIELLSVSRFSSKLPSLTFFMLFPTIGR